MFIEYGSNSSSMPESADWRVEHSPRRRLPSEYASRILDFLLHVQVRDIPVPIDLYRSNLMLTRSRLLSDSGRSFSFDNRGTGFGRGEGCGMIVLKPLDQAVRDNDSIRAVIAGTGLNQDGKTPGITMPNGDAQGELASLVTPILQRVWLTYSRGPHAASLRQRWAGSQFMRLC